MTALLDARAKAAAVLAPVTQADPSVLVSLVDGLEPPALMIGWGEPWLSAMTQCNYEGRLVVTCVSGRLDPGEGITKLEELVQYVLGRFGADTSPWPLDSVGGPRVFTIGTVNYLAARVTVRVPIEGGT